MVPPNMENSVSKHKDPGLQNAECAMIHYISDLDDPEVVSSARDQ